MVDVAVLNGNPCIYGSHTQRQANCRDCSAVAFSRLLKSRREKLRKESGQSTAHKADTPCLDLYLEYRAMKMAENARKLSSKEFDEFVNNELKGQVRVCANAAAKHWVKENFSLSSDGGLYWGKGNGRQRQIKREDGSKAQGRIMRDYEAAELVHKIHQDGHCGRDTLIARIQQEGNKPPVKEVVAAWIRDCTGCNHGSKKRSLDDSTPAAVSGPPSKRQKADPRKTKAAATPKEEAAATPRAPETNERKDSLSPTLKAILAEAAQLRSAPAPAAAATTTELPQEAMQDLDESGIASLEVLIAGFDEAAFNATVESVENAAQEYGIPENTQASPAGAQEPVYGPKELDISWFYVGGTMEMQDASRSSG
ncbi:hypothetical protein IWX90DRAFT_181898 [Phyllosticta citrichinensis]|uniref:Uncharacterized protein n=1 Tax=Phyllosticta citrichinensis TaxID=1130410 RepID=A0ABR1XWC0_9PEZI